MARTRALTSGVRMTRGETIFGWIYLPFYLVLNALLIPWLLDLLGQRIDVYTVNLIYFYLNFLVISLGFRHFLGDSLRRTRPLTLITGVLTGFGIHYLGNILLVALEELLPAYSNPADAATTDMILNQSGIMTVCAVFLGPLVEEVLVRGLVFAPLARSSRILAYVVSTLFFSAMHLWSFLGSVPVTELLLSMLGYIPGSIALAYAYEHSGSIWSPIALHMLINGMSVWALTTL